MPSPSAHAGEGCSAGRAAAATCRFIAKLQKDGPAGLFNEEFRAAQSGQPLPDVPWRVEGCDEDDPAIVTCRVNFASRETTGTFRLVATNAEDGDGRLVLLEGVEPTYAVEEYAL